MISAGFGFSDFIQRYGVERRIYTSGRSKSMLDPFQPEREEDVARLREIQERVHEGFIEHVRKRREGKLADDDDLFTGAIWVGEGAREVGLVDGIGHLVPTMKERYGDKVRFMVYERRRTIFGRLGVALTESVAGALEERLGFARYGL